MMHILFAISVVGFIGSVVLLTYVLVGTLFGDVDL